MAALACRDLVSSRQDGPWNKETSAQQTGLELHRQGSFLTSLLPLASKGISDNLIQPDPHFCCNETLSFTLHDSFHFSYMKKKFNSFQKVGVGKEGMKILLLLFLLPPPSTRMITSCKGLWVRPLSSKTMKLLITKLIGLLKGYSIFIQKKVLYKYLVWYTKWFWYDCQMVPPGDLYLLIWIIY